MKTLGYGEKTGRIKGLVVAFAIVIAAATGFAGAARAAEPEHPTVLVFESVQGDGISKELATSATRAIRTYFRETRRVEAVIINADSPTAQRAVMEKKLTLESLAKDTARERRVEIAKTLGFEYAASAEVLVKSDLEAVMQGNMPKPPKGKITTRDELSTVKADFVQVKLWLSKVDGGKREQWDVTQAAMLSGTKDMDKDNAIQSAISAAVLDLTRKAFAKVAPSEKTPIPTGDESVAISAEQPTAAPLTASDYIQMADESVEAGNIAQAIQQYSQAVSADPSNGKLRTKLAEAYARKGLYDQADEELDRALQIGINKAVVDASRARVEQIRSGATVAVNPKTDTAPTAETPSKVDLKPNAPAYPPPAGGGIRLTKDSVAHSTARLIQGDGLWTKGEPDDAALAYAEAIKLNPSDPRGYERLAAVNASMSLFGEARKAVEQLKKVQPEPTQETTEKRYEMFRKAFDRAFAMLITQLDADTADFDKRVITRESYYSTVNGIGIRLDAMSKFMDALTVPAAKQPAHLRRTLACGLVAQAAADTLDYLETNNATSRKNAQLFIAQAKKESEAASKMDTNKIVIKKEEPTPPTPAQPTVSNDENQQAYSNDPEDQPANYQPQPM